jgi:LytS/YehU family sensor histidine kinase
VRATGKACEITVENPLPDGVAEPPARAGNQLALDNVRQRLGAHFGDDGRLEVARVDGVFRVTLRVPLAAAV